MIKRFICMCVSGVLVVDVNFIFYFIFILFLMKFFYLEKNIIIVLLKVVYFIEYIVLCYF